MKLKRIRRRLKRYIKNHWFLMKYHYSRPGTAHWLIKTEIKYGGFHSGLHRNKVSTFDPRTDEQIKKGGMRGGDRMLHHNYANKYAEYLRPFINQTGPLILIEVGILRGTGLAIWSELFNNARIVGVDIDLGHIQDNMDNLINKGAFRNGQPELYEFDQFKDNTEFFNNLLKDHKIDIFIDDGCHTNEAILKTFSNVLPYLAEKFVYLVEDNKEVHSEIKILYPQLLIDNCGQLTIINR